MGVTRAMGRFPPDPPRARRPPPPPRRMPLSAAARRGGELPNTVATRSGASRRRSIQASQSLEAPLRRRCTQRRPPKVSRKGLRNGTRDSVERASSPWRRSPSAPRCACAARLIRCGGVRVLAGACRRRLRRCPRAPALKDVGGTVASRQHWRDSSAGPAGGMGCPAPTRRRPSRCTPWTPSGRCRRGQAAGPVSHGMQAGRRSAMSWTGTVRMVIVARRARQDGVGRSRPSATACAVPGAITEGAAPCGRLSADVPSRYRPSAGIPITRW